MSFYRSKFIVIARPSLAQRVLYYPMTLAVAMFGCTAGGFAVGVACMYAFKACGGSL